ncbi:Sec-independent protein translocase protein TatB [Ideonella azotifigens]|uniref:Sec-independent protein translocase protein TatB n=1 Tax=Ideonella azotifigens TaxID=513160 RepID=A0ABN1KMZ9_9BURK|nr:Sec-independent protein translocase protein TatB [Ideonella azotifigens]MCD2343459.1 Sec-independent protein translocase protein TatB [Ideonella azotifigens]
MIDFGFDKIALIGAVALIVIGPEKLPRVARTVGHLVGKAQRYVADVKAEVNRSIELEELQKMKSQFETAANDVSNSVRQEIHSASTELEKTWSEAADGLNSTSGSASAVDWSPPPPVYQPPRKHWRVKRGAVPRWYKQRNGVRQHAQSGAARVARFRPPHSGSSSST